MKFEWDESKRQEDIPDSEIDFSDIPPLEKDFWDNAVIKPAKVKKVISIRLDPEVLTFFKNQGRGYQSKINAVLRSYVKHQTA